MLYSCTVAADIRSPDQYNIPCAMHTPTRIPVYKHTFFNFITIYLREYPLSSRGYFSRPYFLKYILYELLHLKLSVNFSDLETKLNFLPRVRYALCIPILSLSSTNTVLSYGSQNIRLLTEFLSLSLSLFRCPLFLPMPLG